MFRQKITVFIMGLLVLVIVVLSVIIFTGNSKGATQEEEAKKKRDTVVTEENLEEFLEQEAEETVEPGYYETMMNTTWHFDSSEEASTDAYVANSKNNLNSVYFDVALSDTGEIIYSSPIIPVGSHLDNITLDTKLEAGNHQCIITYYLLDDEDEPVSKLNIRMNVVIAN